MFHILYRGIDALQDNNLLTILSMTLIKKLLIKFTFIIFYFYAVYFKSSEVLPLLEVIYL